MLSVCVVGRSCESDKIILNHLDMMINFLINYKRHLNNKYDSRSVHSIHTYKRLILC